MALPRSKSLWRKEKRAGTAARMNAPRKPARKRNKQCIATGGDKFIMQINLDTKPFASLETDALVTYLFEDSAPVQGRIAELDKLAGGLLTRLAKSGELTGKNLEFTLVHAPAGLKAARLLLVGAGKREQANPAKLRNVPAAALLYLKARGVHKLAFLVRENDLPAAPTQATPEAALTTRFKTH